MAAKLKRTDFEEPTLQAAELRGLPNRTLVMAADDEEVTLEHTVEMYRSLPDAELAIIPGTSHGLLHEKPELCNAIIGEFLTADAISTIATVRRANGC